MNKNSFFAWLIDLLWTTLIAVTYATAGIIIVLNETNGNTGFFKTWVVPILILFVGAQLLDLYGKHRNDLYKHFE